MADQFAYKLDVYRNSGTEHQYIQYAINDYWKLERDKGILASQGWEEYAQWTMNTGVWYHVGGGLLVPPPIPEG